MAKKEVHYNWGGKRSNQGRGRTCNCSTWGCVTCMGRFLQAHFRKQGQLKREAERELRRSKKEVWDRTTGKENWLED